MTSRQLPSAQRALVLRSTSEPPKVETVPVPPAIPGTAIVRISAAGVIGYMGDVYSGKRPYPLPMPLIIGTSAIGRIAAVGPDATTLQPGQLVLVDCFIKGRDDESSAVLLGLMEGFSDATRTLARGEWRDGTFCEYAKVPLENCFPINEKRLSERDLVYTPAYLTQISACLVPYGGLRDVNLIAGETVVIAPATGQFGSGAVRCALAMGAKVIAMGRNPNSLKRLEGLSDRVNTVPMTGDVEKDLAALREHGPIDVYFDISPPAAAKSTHMRTCISALTKGGRVSLMGGIRDMVEFDHNAIMHQNLTLRGTWMYTRHQIKDLIKMVEIGVLKIGKGDGVEVVGTFPLEQWKEAFDTSAENAGLGQVVVITP